MDDELFGQAGGHFAGNEEGHGAHGARHHQQHVEIHGPCGVGQGEVVHAQLPQKRKGPGSAKGRKGPEAGQGQHQAVGESKQDQSKRHAFSSWSAGASGPSWSASIIR